MAGNDDKELKTIKFQMMLSPGEAEQIDEWMFKRRIKSRAEAIRRMCQIAMMVSETHAQLADQALAIMNLVGDFGEHRKTPSGGKSASVFLDDLVPEIYDLVGRAFSVSAAGRAMELGETFEEALAEHSEMKKVLKEFTNNTEIFREARKAEIAARKKD